MQKIHTVNEILQLPRFWHPKCWATNRIFAQIQMPKRTNVSPLNVLVLLCVLSWFQITHKPDFLCREFKFIAKIRTLQGYGFISISINLLFFPLVGQTDSNQRSKSQMENPTFLRIETIIMNFSNQIGLNANKIEKYEYWVRPFLSH